MQGGSTYWGLWLMPIRKHLSVNDLRDLQIQTTQYTEDLKANVGWGRLNGYAHGIQSC